MPVELTDEEFLGAPASPAVKELSDEEFLGPSTIKPRDYLTAPAIRKPLTAPVAGISMGTPPPTPVLTPRDLKAQLEQRAAGPELVSNVLVPFSEGGMKALTLSPSAALETMEQGTEAAASSLLGRPVQWMWHPSETMRRQIIGKIPEVPSKPSMSTPAALGVGTVNAVVEFANFLQTPEFIAYLGIGKLPKPAQQAALADISGQVAAQAPEQFNDALEKFRKGDVAGGMKSAVSGTISVGVAAGAGKGAVRVGETPMLKVPAEKPISPAGPVPPLPEAAPEAAITPSKTVAPAGEITAKVGTVAEPPIPEAPATLQEQVRLAADPASTRAAALITSGAEFSGQVPEGMKSTLTKHGTVIWNPDKVTEAQVTAAAKGDVFDNRILGGASGTKPVQGDTVVTTKTPAADDVQTELVPTGDAAAVEAAKKAQQSAVPGGTTEVKPAVEVLEKREAEKAVQKRGAEAVPVEVPPRGSAEVGARIPAPEAPAEAQAAAKNLPPQEPVKGAEKSGAAIPKAQAKVTQVARTEGQRSAKEIKDELVSRIQKAIDDSKVDSPDKPKSVVIDIPDDGTFTIRNTPEALQQVLERAQKIKTDEGRTTGKVKGDAVAKAEVTKLRGQFSLPEEITPDVVAKVSEQGRIFEDMVKGLKDTDPLPIYAKAVRGVGKKNDWLASLFASVRNRAPSPYWSTEHPSTVTVGEARMWLENRERQVKSLSEKPTPPPPSPTGGEMRPGPGAATGAAVVRAGEAPPEFYEGTSLKNAVGEVERASYGLPEATATEKRNMAMRWIEAGKRIEQDPTAGSQAVDLLKTDPTRGVTDLDSALILREKVKIENALNNAAERTFRETDPGRKAAAQLEWDTLSDRLLEILDAAKQRGSEWGREGRWRQAIGYSDFSFASLERQARMAKGGEMLSDAERVTLKNISDKNAELEKRIKERDEQLSQVASKLAEAELKAESAAEKRYAPKVLKMAEDYAKKWDVRGQKALSEIKALLTDPNQMLATLNPELLDKLAIYGVSKIVRGAVDFAKWTDAMVADIGDKFRNHAQAVWDRSQSLLDADLEKSTKSVAKVVADKVKEKVKKTPAENIEGLVGKAAEKLKANDLRAINYYAKKIERIFYEQGITDREARIDAVHGVLEGITPDWTRRNTRDAMSGYGDYRPLSMDEVSVALRKARGEMLELSKLDDMLAGEPPKKSGVMRGEISEERRRLIKAVNDAKFNFQVPITDPKTQLKSALDTRKTQLQNQITDYQDRINRGDFVRKPRRELMLDKTANDLMAERNQVRNRFEALKRKWELENMPSWKRWLRRGVQFERAMKLSSPIVFGKLTGAAMTRVAETITSELAGAGLGQLPILRTVAKQAPREGGINFKALAHAATEAVTQGMADAAETARTGKTKLEAMLGKESGLDQDWMNIFGQLHGMMKAPIKRAEFTYSLEKRIEHAARNGEDVMDPQVMQRLTIAAVDDGLRSIFMQRGFTADQFQRAMTMMEKSKEHPVVGPISAATARFFFPIVRVPINIVAETGMGVHGTVTGSARVMFHLVKGDLARLDPKVADSIMRQFKKGSIGLGLMAIGYFFPENTGGLDWREKRKAGDAKLAAFKIPALAGVWPIDDQGNVPRWLTHAPWFNLMQIGATIRHVSEQTVKGQEKGIGEGMWAAAFGLLEETPFIGQMVRASRGMESGRARTDFMGELAKSTVSPQAVIKLAEVLDPLDKEMFKRKPKTVWEHVKMGIPYLRETVEDVPVKNR